MIEALRCRAGAIGELRTPCTQGHGLAVGATGTRRHRHGLEPLDGPVQPRVRLLQPTRTVASAIRHALILREAEPPWQSAQMAQKATPVIIVHNIAHARAAA